MVENFFFLASVAAVVGENERSDSAETRKKTQMMPRRETRREKRKDDAIGKFRVRYRRRLEGLRN